MNKVVLPGVVDELKPVNDTYYETPAGGTVFNKPVSCGKVKNVIISGLKGPGGYGIDYAGGGSFLEHGGGGNNGIKVWGLDMKRQNGANLLNLVSKTYAYGGLPYKGTFDSMLWANVEFQHCKLQQNNKIGYGTWDTDMDYSAGILTKDFWWGNNVGADPVILETHNMLAFRAENWTIRSKATKNVDCGAFWIEIGNGQWVNIDAEMAYGYLFRLGIVKDSRVPLNQESFANNCKKVLSTHYGLGSVRIDDFSNNRTHIGKNGAVGGDFEFANCTIADTTGQGYYAGLSVIGDMRNEAGKPGTVKITKCYAGNVFVENQWKLGLYSDDSGGNANIVVDGVSVPQPKENPQTHTSFPGTTWPIPATDKLGADYYPITGSPLLASGIGARPIPAVALPADPTATSTGTGTGTGTGGGTTTPPATDPIVEVDTVLKFKSGKTQTFTAKP